MASPPPPSYSNAVSTPSRRAPQPVPEPLVLYTIDLAVFQQAATERPPISFPEPADVWQARDVTQADWASFVSGLAATHYSDDKKEEVDAGGLERAQQLLATWNDDFFGPRGCRVIAKGSEEEKQAGSGKSSSWDFVFNKEQIGLKVGKGIFGVDLSKKSSGE